MNNTNHNLLGAICFALILNLAMTFLAWNEAKVAREEINAPKAVQIRSNGVVSQWPIDGKYVKVIRNETD